MYDEFSSDAAQYTAPEESKQAQTSSKLKPLEEAVGSVLMIEQQELAPGDQLIARFRGVLSLQSEAAYHLLDDKLKPLGYHARFMNAEDDNNKHVVLIMNGRIVKPEPRRWHWNALLFGLTILSTMLAGATIDGSITSTTDLLNGSILRGLPYTLSLLLILGAHELGHYFAARYHNVAVTLPYFIPFPFGFFGTLGAFIQLREPMRNRKQLFDVGISGPLAGLVFCIPILFIGIATSTVDDLPTEEDCEQDGTCMYILEGNSVLYSAVKYVIHGKWLPTDTEDMSLNQLAFAGWTGLFVTGLNLVPVGQLDGGHVLYSLIGKYARWLYFPAIGVMIILAINNNGWFLWVLLLFLFGRVYAVPLDDVSRLDTRRRILGVITLLLFFLIFTPSPFRIIDLS